ncbi:MAG: nucleotidyltransferase domain-containing protein [Candidatus Edwardsbacteria bacterium]|nr:nucleotidyltransferase domain-containing protein [Candidatus Edwardsbacteria bacterium]
MLDVLFNSTLRAKVLGWLFTHPGERFYVRQLSGILSNDPTNVGRELDKLARLGILVCRPEGREKYYQANKRCPIYLELKGLAVKTSGLAGVLTEALAPLARRIKAAFIFGSFAEGRETPASDVDLMVIGGAGFGEIAKALCPAQERLGREVNIAVYPENEFKAKLKSGHHFITSVCRGEKIHVIGGDEDLGRLVEKRVAGRAQSKRP